MGGAQRDMMGWRMVGENRDVGWGALVFTQLCVYILLRKVGKCRAALCPVGGEQEVEVMGVGSWSVRG